MHGVQLRSYLQFINEVSGSKLGISDATDPCTLEIQTSRPFRYLDHRIVFIDTPGLDNTTATDEDVVADTVSWLKNAYVSPSCSSISESYVS